MWMDGHLLTGLTWQSAPALPSQCWSSSSLRWMSSWNKSPPGKDRLWATPGKCSSSKTARSLDHPCIPYQNSPEKSQGLSVGPRITSDAYDSLNKGLSQTALVPWNLSQFIQPKEFLFYFKPLQNYLYFTGNLRSTFSLAIWAELKAKTCPQLCQSLGVL